jgi:glycosyltransferase involved in cell wall biosynthesis
MKISIVAPAYNEEEGITFFLEELKIATIAYSNNLEVIIVNDGSVDGTRNKILDFNWSNLRLINLVSNAGHMGALEAGLKAATGDLVITMDSDLQHPPKHIPTLIERYEESNSDVILMTRLRGSEESLIRRNSSRFFYRVLSRISNLDIQPDAAEFRLMTKEVVGVLNSLPEVSKIYRFLISSLGFKVESIEYQSPARKHGKSKYSGKHLWRLAISSVIGFSTFPLSAIFIGGLLTFGISMSYLVFILITYHQENQVQGWASVMITLLGLSSLQIISLGIIGRYISQILTEVRKRPQFLFRNEENSEF